MGIFDKFKKNRKKVADQIFATMTAGPEIEMFNKYLLTPSFLNPNPEMTFDATWSWEPLTKFLDKFCEDISYDQENMPLGIIILGANYKNFQFSFNFAPHNPRVLRITLRNVDASNKFQNAKIEFEGGPTMDSMAEYVNEVNIHDNRHLIALDILDETGFITLQVSMQLIFTEDFGDENVIQEACDSLIIYTSNLLSSFYNGESFISHIPKEDDFLPLCPITQIYNDYERRNDALEFWFCNYVNIHFGKRIIENSSTSFSTIVPNINNSSQDNFKEIMAVALPFGENGVVVEFNDKEKSKVKVTINKECPLIYFIEVKNLKTFFERDDIILKNRTEEDIKDFCLQANAMIKNSLIKFIWERQEDNSLDFSIRATGLWVGAPQAYARIDILGEFYKQLAYALLFLTMD